MIPESYHPVNRSTKVEALPDRRKSDPIIEKVAEIVEGMRQDVAEKLADYEKVIDIRFSHTDALLSQLRDDQKDGQAAIISAVEKIIQLHVDKQNMRIDSIEGCLDTHVREMRVEIGSHHNRLTALEQAPAKEALDNKTKAVEGIKNALIGAGIVGIIAIIGAIARWDDLIKWMGGKP